MRQEVRKVLTLIFGDRIWADVLDQELIVRHNREFCFLRMEFLPLISMQIAVRLYLHIRRLSHFGTSVLEAKLRVRKMHGRTLFDSKHLAGHTLSSDIDAEASRVHHLL